MKIIKAPAKINIVLRVLGRRADGYHDLLMLNEKLALADEISIGIKKTDSLRIGLTCDDASVPCDETNLCYKAASAVAAELALLDSDSKTTLRLCSGHGFAATINIKKRIPVAAGLGGGSSDAAAVLVGLNEALGLDFSRERLSEIGVKLGADVPFFLYDGPAVCEGIGDKITTLNKLPNMWIILVNPSFPVSTKWVYEEFDKGPPLQLTANGSHARLPCHFEGLEEVAAVVHNDLELVTAQKYPEIGQIKKMLIDVGAAASWMSGSGPTVVGMFGEEKIRDIALNKIGKENWRVIATRNVRIGERASDLLRASERGTGGNGEGCRADRSPRSDK